MSLKVSSGLKATAQEWTPSFSTTAKPAAVAAVTDATSAPRNATVPNTAKHGNNSAGGFDQFYGRGEYFGPNAGYYDGAQYAGYYQPSPWDMATMGHQGGHSGGKPYQQQSRRSKGSGRRSQDSRNNSNNDASGSGSSGKRKKKKKKKKQGNSSAADNAVIKPVKIVPNRILVFKNLPFSFTVAELEAIIAKECGGMQPATTSFHRDKNGQFKGFCFVYFDSIESATRVLERLNGYTLQGRTWSIEFKRMNPGDADSGASLVPTGPAHPSSSSSSSGMGGGSMVRSGSHGIPKLSVSSSGGRNKFRSVSESDADMNWRRTKVESDFPPKDETGRKIYRCLLYTSPSPRDRG